MKTFVQISNLYNEAMMSRCLDYCLGVYTVKQSRR